MLHNILLVVHVLVAIGVIGLVLIQQGKGADAGAAFGGGASGTVFGSQGSASFLTRTTAILATVFFLTSLSLTYLATSQNKAESVVDTVPAKQETVKDDSAVPSATTEEKKPASDVPVSE